MLAQGERERVLRIRTDREGRGLARSAWARRERLGTMTGVVAWALVMMTEKTGVESSSQVDSHSSRRLEPVFRNVPNRPDFLGSGKRADSDSVRPWRAAPQRSAMQARSRSTARDRLLRRWPAASRAACSPARTTLRCVSPPLEMSCAVGLGRSRHKEWPSRLSFGGCCDLSFSRFQR